MVPSLPLGQADRLPLAVAATFVVDNQPDCSADPAPVTGGEPYLAGETLRLYVPFEKKTTRTTREQATHPGLIPGVSRLMACDGSRATIPAGQGLDDRVSSCLRPVLGLTNVKQCL